MKKLCAVLLSLCIILSCCCAEQLLPDFSLLLPVEMPSMRHFTDREPVSDTVPENGGRELVFDGITREAYEGFSAYLSERGCALDAYSIENGVLNALMSLEGAGFTFVYDAKTQRATITSPAGTVEETVIKEEPIAEAPVLRSATIRTLGDFVVHDTVFKAAKRDGNAQIEYDFSPMLSYIKDYIGGADFTVANVDGCLGGKDAYKYGYSGYPQFNTPEHILYALKEAGVDMLTLANNHMLDGWFDGLQGTIANVENVGLYHIGANRSAAEKEQPYILEINGISVGFMNYTVSLNSMDTAKGMDPKALEFGVNATKNSDPTAYAASLRAAGADVIVCFMHWGTEYTSSPDKDQESLADMLVTAGVDVIMGGHPHQVQPAKWLTGTNQFGEEQKTLCVYSIGNFLSDQRGESTSGGIIFDFTIQERADGSFEITSPGYIPTWVWRTGSGDSDYKYYVLPTQDYLRTRPAGMSNKDYEAMLANYNSSLSVMQKGVGDLIRG